MRALQRRDLTRDLGVAALRGAALTVEPLLDALEIGHHELELERVEIAGGVRLDPAVVERAQDHEDGVAVAYRAEHLGAETFTGLEPGRQREVHQLEAGRHDLLRLRHLREQVSVRRARLRSPLPLRTRSAPRAR